MKLETMVNRRDGWKSEDDLILAEVVLRHIREGRTQLEGFTEAGERLGRTRNACGFRWNSTVRKQYQAAVVIALKQGKKLSDAKAAQKYADHLERKRESKRTPSRLREYLQLLTSEVNRIERENEELQKENADLRKRLDKNYTVELNGKVLNGVL